MFRHVATRPTQSLSRSIRRNHSVRELMEKSRPANSPPTPLSPYTTTIGKVAMILQWTLIPGTFAYMALYADFGEREHVFSELRRWVKRQKAEFWELSPEERQIATEESPVNPESTP